MKVNYQEIDKLNAKLTVNLDKEDYEPKINEELRRVRKSVNIKGFRPGNAPVDMVKKLYGKSIKADAVNQVANTVLFDYLRDNKLEILGQPLLTAEQVTDVENSDQFSFDFELGLAPEFEVNISDADVLTRYRITVTDAMIDKEVDRYRRNFGKFEKAEISQNDDVIYGEVTELGADGQPLEGGVADKLISTVPNLVKDEDLKASLINLKVGDVIPVNIRKLFNDNASVMKNTLGISEEAVNDLMDNFSFKITTIETHVPAEINQELFNQAFGEGEVNSEEEFRNRIRTDIEKYFENEAQVFLEHELTHLMQDKHNVTLPDEFLKKWLQYSYPKDFTEENMDEKYPKEAETFRFQMVVNKVAEKYELRPTEDDIKGHAFWDVYNLYRRVGIQYPDPEQVNGYAMKELKNEEFRDRMERKALNSLVVKKLSEVVTVRESEIGEEEFYQLLNQHKH